MAEVFLDYKSTPSDGGIEYYVRVTDLYTKTGTRFEGNELQGISENFKKTHPNGRVESRDGLTLEVYFGEYVEEPWNDIRQLLEYFTIPQDLQCHYANGDEFIHETDGNVWQWYSRASNLQYAAPDGMIAMHRE